MLLAAMLPILASLAACGGSPTGTASATPSPSPSASRDPQATVHTFLRQGFSLAYTGRWVARFPSGRDWQAKDPPPGQAARWSMTLVGYSNSSATAHPPQIVVTVRLDNTAVDPAVYQHDAAKSLAAEYPSQEFQPTTVDGIPALMATVSGPNANPAIAAERYAFGGSGIVYDIEVRGPMSTWSTDAPALRGIVQSFTLPGG